MSDTSVAGQKKKLRDQLKSLRAELSESDYTEKSKQVVRNIEGSAYYKESSTIHSFIPILRRREVNIEPLLSKAIQNGKRVVCPKMKFESNVMYHYQVDALEELIPNGWGIREPKPDIPVEVASIDMVLVPMLGGDRSLRRIGYGKGYYDRFLNQVDGYKVGVLFHEAVLPARSIPVEPHDVRLDAIVTDKEIIS